MLGCFQAFLSGLARSREIGTLRGTEAHRSVRIHEETPRRLSQTESHDGKPNVAYTQVNPVLLKR